MHPLNPHDPSLIMAGLFGKIPLHTEYFVVRRLDMKGRKVEMPSPPIRAHIHCFFFVTSGEALITIGEESYFFKTSECAVIPAGQVFSVHYFDNCTGYMGGFNTEFLNSNNDGKNLFKSFSALRRWGAHKVLFDEERAKYIGDIFERLFTEHTTRKNKNIIRAYLTTLLTEIEEISRQPDSPANIQQTENGICNKFIELVFEFSDHSIPLSEYAEKLNITKNYLQKIVKRFTDKTPVTWITEAIILEAKVLLCQTDMNMNEISSSVGMMDPSYFSRLFKKQTDMTPQKYREIQKSQNCLL
ncbi:HTH-type transcriptional regulator CdhR [termite gut metagenome]|uniref:HTH-type transcriptional regulator CdhR n=1 Tax=termite gut metagenome TaxID=433724 RepID=A0A5J4RHA8_9ZZZZ